VERKAEVDLPDLIRSVACDAFWHNYLSTAKQIGLHLAIFTEPLLSAVLDGSKTIESRFSQLRCAPFDEVRGGDVVLLKRPGGPVTGIVMVESAWFFDLAFEPLERIRNRHAEAIGADDTFWASKRFARYATLIKLAEPSEIEPFFCAKRDRRGWVPLTPRQLQLL
jgi:hypothetical protein